MNPLPIYPDLPYSFNILYYLYPPNKHDQSKKSLQIDLIFPGSSAVTPAEVEIICEKKIKFQIKYSRKRKNGGKSGQFPPKLGWIGCVNQKTNPKWLPRFSFFLHGFSKILCRYETIKNLRSIPSYCCHILFQLQLGCCVSL